MLWCTCPDFAQHRLPCKHLLSVAEGKLNKLPPVYQAAVEFNSTEQMKGEYCASVLAISENMKKTPETMQSDVTELTAECHPSPSLPDEPSQINQHESEREVAEEENVTEIPSRAQARQYFLGA